MSALTFRVVEEEPSDDDDMVAIDLVSGVTLIAVGDVNAIWARVLDGTGVIAVPSPSNFIEADLVWINPAHVVTVRLAHRDTPGPGTRQGWKVSD